MKIITNDAQTFSVQQPNIEAIYLNIQIGNGGSFSKPIPFLFDTGALGDAAIYIPASLLTQIEMDIPPVAESHSELGDGSMTQNEYIGTVNIRFICIPSGRPMIFEGVRVTVNQDSTADPVINLTAYCDTVIKEGRLVLLEFNPKAVTTG